MRYHLKNKLKINYLICLLTLLTFNCFAQQTVEKKGGDELKGKLIELRSKMLSVVNADVRPSFEKDLPIKIVEPAKSDNNPQGDWATGYFYNMPTMAVVTLLSKFQNDVRNSEALVVSRLFEEAGNQQIRFDDFMAIAVPTQSYVLAGQKVEAKISLAAYNKAINPSVSASSGRVTKVENGVAYWETTAGGVGPQKIRGNVSMNLGGRTETRPYEFSFMVGSTGASIQLDKMNVFYIGVANPISITAAGYSIEDVSVSIPNATPTKTGNGKYDVTVTTPGKVRAAIMAKTATGVKEVGAMEIRVKTIPDPVAKVGNKTGGYMPAAVFRAQAGIVAVLDGFDFEARFKVTSFEFSYLPKATGEYVPPVKVTGNSFSANPAVLRYQSGNAKPGDRIFMENIKGVGPDGRTRQLNTISLTLN
ncbi:MAG: hypothetical protein EOP51_17610 [Sphingobacteriales bacterium]|nr:MAG: hypothetical protein EOP51_17610 [Sphingobacteriales bacterium]